MDSSKKYVSVIMAGSASEKMFIPLSDIRRYPYKAHALKMANESFIEYFSYLFFVKSNQFSYQS